MSTEQNKNWQGNDSVHQPAADTGNASNPSPKDNLDPSNNNQVLNEKAEKYLREVASIEDVPDAQDQAEMDETLKRGRPQQDGNQNR